MKPTGAADSHGACWMPQGIQTVWSAVPEGLTLVELHHQQPLPAMLLLPCSFRAVYPLPQPSVHPGTPICTFLLSAEHMNACTCSSA